MKKITLLATLLVGFAGFSQSSRSIIQNYLEANRAKFELTTQDISDWVIESEVPGSGTGITSTYIVQRYQGTEIFNAQNNVWVKNGQVLNMGNNFQSNIASKINTTSPSLTVFQAIASAYNKLGFTKVPTFKIEETINTKTFKLTDGVHEDLVSAKLVYQTMKDKSLKLAWGFQFYAPSGELWDLRIDALSGAVLEKNNLTISCNFGDHDHLFTDKTKVFSFENSVLNKKLSPIMAAKNAMVPGIPGQYRVIPYNQISPNHSPFELITTNGNLLASPNGWHDANSATGTNASLRFKFTRGNNVLAQTDLLADNQSGTTAALRPDGTATLTFDFPYGGPTALPSTYTNASTTNLFYMNNIMHDVWYQYGFTEASGNFQQNNLGRNPNGTPQQNSATGDYVLADSQDGINNAKTNPPFTASNLQNRNNANFSTPNDGGRPRMQMFMWDQGTPPVEYFTVNTPSVIAGPRIAKDNSFEGTDHIPVPAAPGITRDLALYANIPVNPGQNPNSACAVATNSFDLADKIVLVRRGGCFFKDKVKKAQDEGAVAVIIMDSIPQSPTYIGTLGMTSTGLAGITIPAVSITKDAGEILIAEMANGPVNVTMQTPGNVYLYADGSFDNGIISHEYGHGISNKLIGGPANSSCMNNLEQMGEGWSDWLSLMMQIKTGDTKNDAKTMGTYAQNEPNSGPGIREFPYSYDMIINPRTFADSNIADNTDTGYRYVIGEFWASVLWDLTWAYIDKYGFDPDIYNGTGGNNKVMRLVLDAMKLQTCGTASCLSGRDNLFAAELATTNGANYDMIREVFTRRGMGLNASSGSAQNTNDQTEDFTPFPLLLSNKAYSFNDAVRVYPNPTNDSVNIRVGGLEGTINIQIIDINGRVILNLVDDKFNLEKSVNVSNIEAGIYILNLKADNLNFSQKLIKN